MEACKFIYKYILGVDGLGFDYQMALRQIDHASYTILNRYSALKVGCHRLAVASNAPWERGVGFESMIIHSVYNNPRNLRCTADNCHYDNQTAV